MLDNPTVPNTLGATDYINGKAIDNNDPIPSPIIIFLFFPGPQAFLQKSSGKG